MIDIYLKNVSSKKQTSKTNSKYDFTIEATLPGIQGILSARQLGTIIAMELLDYTRTQWRQGKTFTGESKTLNKKAIRTRAVHYNMLKSSRAPKKRGRDWKRWVEKKYRMTKVQGNIRYGVKSRIKTTTKYLPEPETNTPICNSGLMHDSLNAAWVSRGQTQVKSTGQLVFTTGFIRLRVPAVRNNAAWYVGGIRPQYSNQIQRIIQGNQDSFRYSTSLLRSMFDWYNTQNQPKSIWTRVTQLTRRFL